MSSQNGGSRRYPDRPLLGVGAVVFNGGKILLIERGKEPLKGWWTVPGGLVETGERLEAAVRSETLEETGLLVKPIAAAAVFQNPNGLVEYDLGRSVPIQAAASTKERAIRVCAGCLAGWISAVVRYRE